MSNLAPLSLSIFFPCYNDAMTISSMVLLAAKAATDLSADFEIIVVNDGSPDQSAEVLVELEKLLGSRFRTVTHQKNRGYGGALRSGFSSATKEWIFYTDGDAQYNVSELKILASKINSNIDVVQGFKIKRHDPFYRIYIGKAYQYSMKLLFGLKITDVDCDFRMIRRKVFDKVRLENDSGIICLELVKKIQDFGFVFAEAGVNHFFRAHGTSQFFNFKRVFKVLISIFGLWMRLVIKKEHLKPQNAEIKFG